MLMPKATMYEDQLSAAGENYVWSTRQVLAMQPEPIPLVVE
jgi:hypothetical protein